MTKISAIFREISHFTPNSIFAGKMLNIQKMRNFIPDMREKKNVAFSRPNPGPFLKLRPLKIGKSFLIQY